MPKRPTPKVRGPGTRWLKRSSNRHWPKRMSWSCRRSVARETAYAKLLSRILSAAEAMQAAKLHQELSLEQQLSAGGPDTGTSWTAMHKFPRDILGNAQWRTAAALRLGVPPDAGPGFTCALREGNDGERCGFSLPHFLLQVWASKESPGQRAALAAQPVSCDAPS